MTDIRSRAGAIRSMAIVTVLATAAALAVSWGLNYLLMFADGLSAFGRSAITATLVPLLLTPPLVVYGLWQRKQLRMARRERTRTTAHDPATGFFSERIFAGAVEERRKAVNTSGGPARGALLLVDLAELKQINARFGPEWSASALQIVADAIRRSVRISDMVGRLATGEFGVFLPNASAEDAKRIAQRLIDAVADVYFAPDNTAQPIRIDVAGVVFEHQVQFSELVRNAGTQLVASPEIAGQSGIRIETMAG